MTFTSLSEIFWRSQHHSVSLIVQFVSCYISSQGYYISMQLIGWSFCYISSRALLHFYAAFLLHFYASFITFLCRYYISMQGCYISMQVIFLGFIIIHFYAPHPHVPLFDYPALMDPSSYTRWKFFNFYKTLISEFKIYLSQRGMGINIEVTADNRNKKPLTVKT